MNYLTRIIIIAAVAIILLWLVGCGTDYPDSYGSWSGEYQEQNDNFTVNYDPGVIDGPILNHIENVWLEVQACVGIPTRAGLIIEYTPKSQIKDGNNGYIDFSGKYIRVRVDDMGREDKTLRHEFIHWILFFAGVSREDQDNHISPFFDTC